MNHEQFNGILYNIQVSKCLKVEGILLRIITSMNTVYELSQIKIYHVNILIQ